MFTALYNRDHSNDKKKITPVLWCQMGSSPLLLTLLKIQYSTKIQDAGLQQGPSHHSSVLQSNCSALKVLQIHGFLPFQSILPSISCPGHSGTPLCPLSSYALTVISLTTPCFQKCQLLVASNTHKLNSSFIWRQSNSRAEPNHWLHLLPALSHSVWNRRTEVGDTTECTVPPLTSHGRKHLSFLTGMGPTCNPD